MHHAGLGATKLLASILAIDHEQHCEVLCLVMQTASLPLLLCRLLATAGVLESVPVRRHFVVEVPPSGIVSTVSFKKAWPQLPLLYS